jgi:hypothetical protein
MNMLTRRKNANVAPDRGNTVFAGCRRARQQSRARTRAGMERRR